MIEPTTRPLTAADLAALPAELPSGTVRYELHEGMLRIMAPPGEGHGGVESKISGALRVQGGRCGSPEGGGLRPPDLAAHGAPRMGCHPLALEDLVPGFAVPVADLFEGLD